MRPSYRYALAALALATITMGAWWATLPTLPKPPRMAEPLPLRPQGLEPIETPIVGNPTDAEQAEVLDRLEAFEAQRLGPSEASRRRRFREQEFGARLKGRPAAEPATPEADPEPAAED